MYALEKIFAALSIIRVPEYNYGKSTLPRKKAQYNLSSTPLSTLKLDAPQRLLYLSRPLC